VRVAVEPRIAGRGSRHVVVSRDVRVDGVSRMVIAVVRVQVDVEERRP
jgi:hypothetical protein